jgi:hypothetical protein
MKFLLHSSQKDHCLLKVSLVASVTGTDLEINNATEEQLTSLDSKAKNLLLETPLGSISQHIAIIKYIASSSLVSVSGSDELEKAQIDQWLDFSWQDLGKKSFNLFLKNIY